MRHPCGLRAQCFGGVNFRAESAARVAGARCFWLAILAVGLVQLPASVALAQAAAGTRSVPLSQPAQGHAGFTLLSGPSVGVTFTNFVPEARHLTNQLLLDGGGVAAGDVDGDGRVDLFFSALAGGSGLFRNLGGWRFEDVTGTSGTSVPGLEATGVALVDLDGDGDLDLVENSRGRGTHIFFNDGAGHFAQSAQVLNLGKGGTSLALGDLDGDGFLDLYVANYRPSALMDMPNARATFKRVDGRLEVDRVDGRPTTEPDLADRFAVDARGGVFELGQPDGIYHNAGGTNFLPVPFTGGGFLDEDGRPLTRPPFDWSLSVVIRDTNGDGLPDIYVCSDFQTPDRFWINQGRGVFRALPRLAMRKSSLFSMAVDFADINRDGFDDFLVLDMLNREHFQRMTQLQDYHWSQQTIGRYDDRPQYGYNTLSLNRGDGTYAEIAYFAGLEASDWSWCAAFLDVDLDGWEDLLISNGQFRGGRDRDVIERLKQLRAQKRMTDEEIFEERKAFPSMLPPKAAFRNQGDLRFADAAHAWGFDQVGVSQGMCLADLDGDGDLDVVVNNLNAPAGLYRNESSVPRVAVRLKGMPPNTRGIGARIILHGGAVPRQSQEIVAGGRYLSSDDPVRVFAAGTATNLMRIEVRWRSGKRTVVDGVKADQLYEISESDSQSAPPAIEPPQPFFEDVSALLNHTHHEEPFDDFARQPLLPNRLSQLGPGVAWGDLNDDGHEDLVVGSGKGGSLAVFMGDGQGKFRAAGAGRTNAPAARDQAGIVIFREGTTPARVLVGSANYEDGSESAASVQQFDPQTGSFEDALPGSAASTGPLALTDFLGGGQMALFVGGRVIAGRYPEAADSRLFRRVAGQWELDATNTAALAKAGLVSGAVWSDLDGDAFPDLLLACEWGPIRVFRNERGQLREITTQLGLAEFTGWWTGVTTGDLDGDGRMDIIAGNWGLNSKYRADREHPRHLYYSDIAGTGNVDLVETYFERGRELPERDLTAMANALPFLRERFQTHARYGAVGIGELLGDRLKQTRQLSVTTLASHVFLNRGDHFEPRLLPGEAQLAPVFAVCVADFDGDGHEDVFLSQNFFSTQPESARSDAGQGLWLRGDGGGRLAAVPSRFSGVRIYGEQRGAASADYDADGRVDLVVSQNGAETRLFLNRTGQPGLRVKLHGPAGNPDGVGAVLRLRTAEGWGPAQEIRAGGGYWSHDSVIQVLHGAGAFQEIQVRAVGGATTNVTVAFGSGTLAIQLP